MEIVRLLLSHGASVFAKNIRNYIPLHYARSALFSREPLRGDHPIFQLLVNFHLRVMLRCV